MILSAILAPLVLTRDTEIRYETRAKDVTQIVADLAAITGKKLETEGLRNWPLIVRFEKRPLSQVMALIAQKTDAVWIEKDDRQILTRSKTRVQNAALLEARHRGERLKKWLTSNLGIDGPPRAWTSEETDSIVAQNRKEIDTKAAGLLRLAKPDQVEVASAVTPAKILLQEFCRKISPEVLGGLPISSQIIYSSTPKAPERPLPVELGQAIRAYTQTRSAFAAKLPADTANLDGATIVANDRLSLTPMDPNFVIRFELIRVGTDADIHVGVVLHGSDRRTLLDSYGLQVKLDPLPETPPPAKLKGLVKFEPDSAALMRHMARNRPVLGQLQGPKGGFIVSGAPIPPLPSELLKKVLDPVKRDPQSYFITDWLMSTADALDTDLIASVPDNLFYNLSNALRGSSDLVSLWKLGPAWQLKMKWENGLLDVESVDVAKNDRYRIDRAALAKLMAARTADRFPNWDDQARYAATQPPGAIYQFGLDYRWLRLVDPNQVWMTILFQPVAYRFWGTLDSTSKQMERATIPFGRFSAGQVTLLDELFRSQLALMQPRHLGDYMGGRRPQVFTEESDPVIRDGTFTVEQKPTQLFLARYSNGGEAKLSALELAGLLMAKKASKAPADSLPISVRDMGAARVTFYSEHSQGNSQMQFDLNYGKLGTEESFESPSQDLLAKLEKHLETWKDAKFVDSPPGITNPPPPLHR